MTLLVTSDGVELAARSWMVDGRARAVVVLVHGFAASKDDRNVVAMAERLLDAGLHVVCYDARGHGESGGTCTLGDLERHDVAAAVTWAARLEVPVVVVGASMGAVAVMRHAAATTGFAGIVAVSSPAEWRVPLTVRALVTVGLTRTRPGRWVTDRRLRVRLHPVWSAPESPRSLAARVTAPLAIVHGHRDHLIPPLAALNLYSSGEGKRRLFLVPQMGHAFDPGGHDAICEAVDWILEQAVDAR